jgi:hypothetical protein
VGYLVVVLTQAMFHSCEDDLDVLDVVVVEPGGGMLGHDFHPAGAPVSVALRHSAVVGDPRLAQALALLDSWSKELSIVSLELGEVGQTSYLSLSSEHGEDLVLEVASASS